MKPEGEDPCLSGFWRFPAFLGTPWLVDESLRLLPLSRVTQPSFLVGLTASLVAQRVKNPPAVWETRVRSLGWEDPLEEGKATHSGVLAWRIPWTEEPGGLQSMGLQRAGHD